MVYAEADRGEFVRTKAGVAAATIAQHLEAGDDIRLNECDILGKLTFPDTAQGIISIENCRFEHVIFRETCFLDSVTMSNCYFHGETEFWGVEFNAAASFQGSKFHSRPIFIFASFHDGSDFEYCRFEYGATFFGATFEGNAVFSKAVFHWTANFRNAKFYGKGIIGVGDPTGALVIGEASVSFYHTSFDTVCFANSNLGSAIFEPRGLSDYSMSTLAVAKSLRNLQYFSTADELTTLRKYFREHQHRQKEREITCALERQNQPLIERLLFDWLFEYGSNLARPFKIVFCYIFPICFAFYFLVFRFRIARGVLVTVTLEDDTSHESKTIRKRIAPYDITAHGRLSYVRAWLWREFKIVCVTVFYTLLNTFNLGFRDFDFGRWLRLILPWKVDFQSVGLVKTISGLQAIFSILLMAFGLLFYFGRFFD